MREIVLVRHGRASGGWDDDPDPGLDSVGLAQAVRLAERLGPHGEPTPPMLVTSPLRRCRQTAEPLARRWSVTPTIDPRVAEIPSPDGVPFGERVPWLRAAMGGTWSELGPRYQAYRDEVVATIAALPHGTIVVSHFIAINAVLGVCADDDRLLLRSLDNTSMTVIGVDDTGVHLIAGGDEADTLIR